MIKAICFDLDGVYFTGAGKQAFHKALVELSGDEEKVIHVLYKSPEMLQFVTGKLSEDELWLFARNYLNLTLTNKEFETLWIKEYEIDQEVRSVVLKAKEKGYITCVCSNNNIVRIRALQERFNFLEDFDVKIFSYETGLVKSNKELFQILIDKSGVKPEEIAYSDDKEEVLGGAKELGINAFVYENFEQFLGELKKLGVDLKS
ncbi:MAG: HAD family phosphatase [bacterium]|nr:HAD family phosphatase [bacterium]